MLLEWTSYQDRVVQNQCANYVLGCQILSSLCVMWDRMWQSPITWALHSSVNQTTTVVVMLSNIRNPKQQVLMEQTTYLSGICGIIERGRPSEYGMNFYFQCSLLPLHVYIFLSTYQLHALFCCFLRPTTKDHPVCL